MKYKIKSNQMIMITIYNTKNKKNNYKLTKMFQFKIVIKTHNNNNNKKIILN